MPHCPLGSSWQVGQFGGGSNGAALTSPTPLVSADMPTPAAITAAEIKCFGFIVRVPPQARTTLVTSCLVGYAKTTNSERVATGAKIVKNPSLYMIRTYCEDRTKRNPQVRSQPDP